jgi:hypothetical protein
MVKLSQACASPCYSHAVPRPTRSQVRSLVEEIHSGALDAHAATARALTEMDGDRALALLLAAAVAGIAVDLELVRDALPLIDDPTILPVLLGHTSGDRSAMLLDAVESGHLGEEREVIVLLLMVVLGPPHPTKLASLLRTRARLTRSSFVAAILVAAARELGDPRVLAVMNDTLLPLADPAMTSLVAARVRADLTLPILDALPEHAERFGLGTVRRATPKVGRNDPCPCGSGKKYKRCCEGKEPTATPKERLREVAGTFTAKDVARLRTQDLLQLDLAALPSEPLFIACQRLLDYRRWDHVERALGLLEDRGDDREEVDELREELVDVALEERQLEIAKRSIAKLGGIGALSDSTRLLLEVLEPQSSTLEVLEEHTLRGLEGDHERVVDLAFSLLQHRPALGIVFARGTISTDRPLDAMAVLDGIEEARDVLGLPPGDPAGEAYDALIDLDMDERVRTAGTSTSEAHERAVAEAAELRARGKESSSRIAELERRLREQEAGLAARDASSQQPAVAPAPRSPAEEDERRRLRGKIDELKGLISEGNRERTELRRALAERTSALAKEDEERPKDTDTTEDTRFERDLPDGPGVRAVTVPTFAKAAAGAVRELPARVARDALALIAELAGGAASAWRGVKQLERVSPPLLSARVGIHYRVLFRTTDVELEVLEVVHRQGLDAVIRRYA